MSHQVLWNKVILERFIEQASLTELEEHIMRTRAAGWSRVETSMKFGISIQKVDRTIATLKRKYDNVQKYDTILPPRDIYHNVLNPADDD